MIEDKLQLDLEEDIPGLLQYANVPRTIGAVISAGKATLHECETIYSIGDVWLMLEIIAIDAHNKKAAEDWFRKKDH